MKHVKKKGKRTEVVCPNPGGERVSTYAHSGNSSHRVPTPLQRARLLREGYDGFAGEEEKGENGEAEDASVRTNETKAVHESESG